jgi:hypothetical protein
MKKIIIGIGLIASFLPLGLEGCDKKKSKTEKKAAHGASKKHGRSHSPKKKEAPKHHTKSKAKAGKKAHGPKPNAALQQAQANAHQLAQQLQASQAAHNAAQQASALQIAQLIAAQQAAQAEAARRTQETEDAQVRAAEEASRGEMLEQHAEDADLQAALEASRREMLEQYANYLEQGILDLTADLALAQQVRSALDDNMQTAQENLLAGAGNLGQLQEALNQAHANLAQTQQLYAQAQARIQELSAQLEASNQRSAQDQERLLKRIQELEAALHQAQQERAQLEHMFAQFQAEYERREKAQQEAQLFSQELTKILENIDFIESNLKNLEGLPNISKAQDILGALVKQKANAEEKLRAAQAQLEKTSFDQKTKEAFMHGIQITLEGLTEFNARIAKLQDPNIIEQHEDQARIRELEEWAELQLQKLTQDNNELSAINKQVHDLFDNSQVTVEALETALHNLTVARSTVLERLEWLKELPNFKELQKKNPISHKVTRIHGFKVAGGQHKDFDTFLVVANYTIEQLKGKQGKMEEGKAEATAPTLVPSKSNLSDDEVKAALSLENDGTPTLTVNDIKFNAKNNEANFIEALAQLSDSTLKVIGNDLVKLIQKKEAAAGQSLRLKRPTQILTTTVLSMLARFHANGDARAQAKIAILVEPLLATVSNTNQMSEQTYRMLQDRFLKKETRED